MTTTPQPGEVVGDRYVIERQLGEGAFATVWLATETTSDRDVALKILKPDAARGYDERTRARFHREVQLIARLRDPHTVRLYNYGEWQGLLFLVFEYVAGRDLVELLEARGRLEPDEVEHLLRQLLHALREAHSAGLIHRDLKPHNIRVFERDTDPLNAKLLDFGIARATDAGHPSITRTGELIGTPRYMSPEQLRDDPLTPASDIYSLGVVAFELLAGRDALPGSGLHDQFERLLSGHQFSAPKLEGIGPLMRVIERMTAPQLGARFPSAASVLAALAQQPAPASATPRREPSSAPARQAATPAPSRAPWAPAVAIVAVVALLAALFLWVFGGSEQNPNVPATRVPNALLKQTGLASPPPAPVDVGVPMLAPDAAASDVAPRVDAGIGRISIREGAIASPGCGNEPPHRGLGKIEGVATYVPTRYDESTPIPLLVMFHGDYQQAAAFLSASGFADLAERDGVAVIAPQDGNVIGLRSWRDDQEDQARIRQIVHSVNQRLCIDRARVFLVAHSDGGRIAHRLTCEDWVTAFGVNSFTLGTSGYLCDRAVRTISLHPLRSSQMPHEGGLNCNGRPKRSAAQMRQMWLERNGCRGAGRQTYAGGGSSCRSWSCAATLQMCDVNGGAPWPGFSLHQLQMLGRCDDERAPDFPTGERIWDFLLASPPLTTVPERP